MLTGVAVRIGETGVDFGVFVGGDGGVGVEVAEEEAAVAGTGEDVFGVRVVPVVDKGGWESLAGVVVGLDRDCDPKETGVGIGRRGGGDGRGGAGGSSWRVGGRGHGGENL